MRENWFKNRASTDGYKFLKEITHTSLQSTKPSHKTNNREVNRYQSSSSFMCEETQDMEKDCMKDSAGLPSRNKNIESRSKYYTPLSKGRKRKCVGHSKFHWDEEGQAFDADVDESSRSSVEHKLQTTFQSGTTLTWTSSSASSSYTKPSRTNASRLTLVTPPRLRQGLDISSCSELSPLSCDGTTVELLNSSLSCSSESRDNSSSAEWYQTRRKRYPARRTTLTRVPPYVKKPVTSVCLIVDEGISKRHYVDVVKKRVYLPLRTKYVLWKLLFAIMLYVVFSFHKMATMISGKHMFNSNEIVLLSENIILSKKDERQQQNDDGIHIQQSVGGLHLIYDTPRVEELGEVKKGFWGLGEIDSSFYHKSSKYLVSSDLNTSKPRVVFLNGVTDSSMHSKTLIEIDSTPFSDNTQLYGVLSSDDEALSKMEVLVSKEDGECVSETWHKEYYPSCNNVHEFDFIHIDDLPKGNHLRLFEKQGYWRNAWRADVLISKNYSEKETFIIKTPRYSHNFEHAHYEHDRIDALAMSRLTFSPHVVDIYAFCGRTVFTEYAGGPSLGSIFDKAKKYRFRRIEIARDLAKGLSHVHYGKSGATDKDDVHMTHFDINPANIVVTDEHKLRINDFNIAQFVKRNTTSGGQCSIPPHQYPNAQWRSPEEVSEARYLTAKADVFSLGHIFYRLICGHEPWNKFELGSKPTSAMISVKVKSGILPRIPEHVLHSKDPEITAIRKAMLMCYTVEPNERPSSQAIATFLETELERLHNKHVYTE